MGRFLIPSERTAGTHTRSQRDVDVSRGYHLTHKRFGAYSA